MIAPRSGLARDVLHVYSPFADVVSDLSQGSMDSPRDAAAVPAPSLPNASIRRQEPAWVMDCPGVAFLDSKGAWWCVSERPCRAMDPPGMRCLVFMSEAVVRRVLCFPLGWRHLTAEQLEALSWQR